MIAQALLAWAVITLALLGLGAIALGVSRTVCEWAIARAEDFVMWLDKTCDEHHRYPPGGLS